MPIVPYWVLDLPAGSRPVPSPRVLVPLKEPFSLEKLAKGPVGAAGAVWLQRSSACAPPAEERHRCSFPAGEPAMNRWRRTLVPMLLPLALLIVGAYLVWLAMTT